VLVSLKQQADLANASSAEAQQVQAAFNACPQTAPGPRPSGNSSRDQATVTSA